MQPATIRPPRSSMLVSSPAPEGLLQNAEMMQVNIELQGERGTNSRAPITRMPSVRKAALPRHWQYKYASTGPESQRKHAAGSGRVPFAVVAAMTRNNNKRHTKSCPGLSVSLFPCSRGNEHYDEQTSHNCSLHTQWNAAPYDPWDKMTPLRAARAAAVATATGRSCVQRARARATTGGRRPSRAKAAARSGSEAGERNGARGLSRAGARTQTPTATGDRGRRLRVAAGDRPSETATSARLEQKQRWAGTTTAPHWNNNARGPSAPPVR